MALKEVPCNTCGNPAAVHISNMVRGKRLAVDLCMACADRRAQAAGAGPRFRLSMTRADVGGILIAVGLFVLALSAFADFLKFGGSEGFGWKQGAGLVLAGMLALTGSVFGVLMFLVIGVVIGTLTLLADVLAFGSNDGFGIQQLLGTIIGAVILIVGLRLVARSPRGKPISIDASASSPPPPDKPVQR